MREEGKHCIECSVNMMITTLTVQIIIIMPPTDGLSSQVLTLLNFCSCFTALVVTQQRKSLD